MAEQLDKVDPGFSFLMNGWSVLFMGSWLLVDLALATLLPSGFWRAAELADAAAFVKEYPQVKQNSAAVCESFFDLARALHPAAGD